MVSFVHFMRISQIPHEENKKLTLIVVNRNSK